MIRAAACAACALAVALAGIPLTGQAPSVDSVPPARPSARQAFEHRAATPYPVADAEIPPAIHRALLRPYTEIEAGGIGWRLEPAALVRVTPDPVRLDATAGLPLSGLRALAVGSDGTVWGGGSGGVVRFTGRTHPWERWHVFAGRRYLPSNDVKALAPGENGAMWVRTSAGVSHLRLVPMSLGDKATHFERALRARHVRHGLVADSMLTVPGDLRTSHQYPNDNDGLWTSIYAAAQSYRYAVTGSDEALERASAALSALVRLEAITGHEGFPARTFRDPHEPRLAGGEWHWTGDRQWEWKGDTSSDELVGHFYAFAVGYDLLPDGPIKAQIRHAVTRIADHLIRHRYNLVDVDGLPTRWGRWGLDYLETADGKEEQALRAVELLSYLLVASHVTGEQRFQAEYRRLIDEHRFHERMQTYLSNRLELNFSDEELAMLSFHPLFRYERDETLRGFFRRAMDQWWQNIQREDSPLWIYIRAQANPDTPSPLDRAAHTLVRMPLDLVTWSASNAHRLDVPRAREKDRFGRPQTTRLLPPDERHVQRWNANPFELNAGSHGRGEDDGAAYLLPYWMGRYYGYISD
jgi:hypothetical protein